MGGFFIIVFCSPPFCKISKFGNTSLFIYNNYLSSILKKIYFTSYVADFEKNLRKIGKIIFF